MFGSLMENSSYLGTKIARMGSVLRKTATSRINEYQKRLDDANRMYEPLFRDLVVDMIDKEQACKTAIDFFGRESIKFVAIDGTEYSRPLYDMIVFFAGAYSAEGSMNFLDNKIQINYNNKSIELGNDLSSCVPIYIDKIPEIDNSFVTVPHTESEVIKTPTDQVIADNSEISNILMTFSEFYLAYKLAITKHYKMILMDRGLSNTYSGLMYDTSVRSLWSNCAMFGLEVDGIAINVNDLAISRHSIINQDLGLPPSRGDYLKYAILNRLHDYTEGRDLASICRDLKIGQEEKNVKQVERYLSKWTEEEVVSRTQSEFILNDRYRNSWSRIKQIVNTMGDRIFKNEEDPFVIKNQDERKWLTTTDLKFLTLFSLYMLMEECWKNRILLIGMTKDTTAHDFKSHVLPVCVNEDVWSQMNKSSSKLNELPNSDRMFLQFLSIANVNNMKVPWSLIEYDSAFVTAIPDIKNRKGYISGANQNKIIPSRMFVKSYVQLQQSINNPMFRSNVLAVDRLVYSDSDSSNENMIDFKHEYYGEDKLSLILFRNNKSVNKIQNLVMYCLASMSAPSIAEAFGHNKPLYIADKIAKWHNEEFRKIVDSTAAVILCDKGLRNFVYFMNSFREKRQEFENNRRF